MPITTLSSYATSQSFSLPKQAAIHSINNITSRNHPSAKESSIQTFNGILTTHDAVELHINVALRVGIDSDVDDVAVFVFGFDADVVFELFDPVVAGFSAGMC